MITVKENYSLKGHNTFGMDVQCRMWIEYTEAHDLIEIFGADNSHPRKSNEDGLRPTFPLPLKSIGAGSNLLFSHDYPGTLLYNNIADISAVSPGILRVGGGMQMDELVQYTIGKGLWGVENLSGIPGTVGAAAVQNIGAYGVELCDVVDSVEVFDTHEKACKCFNKAQCGYGYRKSIFKASEKDRYVVSYVTLRLSPEPRPHLDYAHLRSVVENPHDQAQIRRAVVNMRDSKLPDPRSHGNAGSFFMNPVVSVEKYCELCSMFPGVDVPKYDVAEGVKVPAAWLIDRAGWRGRQIGGAAVWSKQPLVLVNIDGTATSADIIALKDAIVKDINNKFGIILTPEVEIL